jgi:hypothetical protein
VCFKLRLREALRLWLSLLAPYGSIYYVRSKSFEDIYIWRGVICSTVSP